MLHISYSLKNKGQFDYVNSLGFKSVRSAFINVLITDVLDEVLLIPNLNDTSETQDGKLSKKLYKKVEFIKRPTDDLSNSCGLGMKVGKKIFKKSVTRNKIKRRIRHMIRLLLLEEKLQNVHFAMIIIPRKSFLHIDFNQTYYSLKKLVIYRISTSLS